MEELRGKVAVVTGGASGIGRAVATEAAAEGMRIVLADIEEQVLKVTADELAGNGAEVLSVVTDVSDAASVEDLRDQALSRFGAVHLVHNNAGVGAGGLSWDMPLADWQWTFGVNLWGVVHGIRAFVPLLVEQGAGHVVNTASLAGLVSTPLMAPYNATKFAVVALSETLHKELRLMGSPVGVSVLCPAFVKTGIANSDRNKPEWARRGDPPAAEQQMRGVIHQLVDSGIDPAVVGARVIDAVKTDTFYILTHPESFPVVERRMRDILEGRPPSETPIA
ncbi:MAG: SDR family NAD(P)-dependent oxidoreductase [Acidimicrobiales bacterium]